MVPTPTTIKFDYDEFKSWIEKRSLSAFSKGFENIAATLKGALHEIEVMDASGNFSDSLIERMAIDVKANAFDEVVTTMREIRFV